MEVMSQDGLQRVNNNSAEVSLKDLIVKIKDGIRYFKKKWVIIFSFSVFFALLGLTVNLLKKTTYTAVCRFVLEDSGKGSGFGQYASLANLAGGNLGEGGGGIFQGDNIIELYKSRTMIEKALLSEMDDNKQTLIERYINYNKLRQQWKEKDHIDKIDFLGNPEKFNRQQDSIITDIVDLINKEVLYVEKPDKKLNIINVSVSTHDELFSKEFNDKLVKTVNDFYIQTKTKKENQNVQILQHQSDSVKMSLNASLAGVAGANDAAPNANPLLSSLKVGSQKKQVDVQANTAIYGEMIKNLELAKITLRQETPLIQIIDKPVLPLANNHGGKIKSIVLGFLIGAFLAVFYLTTRKVFSVLSTY